MALKISNNWHKILEQEKAKSYFQSLITFLDEEYKSNTIYPPKESIFRAFELCSPEDVKVVLIGQDPYHGEDQANGLCFSVRKGQKLPPSLKNIFKELHSDLGISTPDNGELDSWAKQGILMLNATLTVRAKTPGSHQKKGWETFTDAIIQFLSDQKENLVFILWGNYAQQKGKNIDTTKHFCISSVHPSPFSVYQGFFGSKPFSKTNEYLSSKKIAPIDWKLPTPETTQGVLF